MKSGQRFTPVRINSDVLIVDDLTPCVSVEGDRQPGEVQSLFPVVSNDLHDIWVLSTFTADLHLQSRHLGVVFDEGSGKKLDVFGTKSWFVSLNIDVNVGLGSIHDLENPVGSGTVFPCQHGGYIVVETELEDSLTVRRNSHIIEQSRYAGSIVDALEQWFSCNVKQRFAGQAP